MIIGIEIGMYACRNEACVDGREVEGVVGDRLQLSRIRSLTNLSTNESGFL